LTPLILPRVSEKNKSRLSHALLYALVLQPFALVTNLVNQAVHIVGIPEPRFVKFWVDSMELFSSATTP
jgi:hypothetical protein